MPGADATYTLYNSMSHADAVAEMTRCCGSQRWCQRMVRARPIRDREQIHILADQAFDELDTNDWLEAFAHHPKIGDLQSLRMKYAGNREWSGGEQSAVADADEVVLQQLAQGNLDYERKFGFIFIVCASGKTAAQMLALLQSRLPMDRATEISNAANEQRAITHLRLDKWQIPS